MGPLKEQIKVPVTEDANSDVPLKEQVKVLVTENANSEELKKETDEVIESIINNVTEDLTNKTLDANECQSKVENPDFTQHQSTFNSCQLNNSAENLNSKEHTTTENNENQNNEQGLEISNCDIKNQN